MIALATDQQELPRLRGDHTFQFHLHLHSPDPPFTRGRDQ
jgi:hypothetical protein